MDMEFPLETEAPGGTQDFLLRLRDSHLEDDLLLEEFYQKVIESYSYDMNYYIILIHAVYDIPGKSSDNLEMFDASDNVYDFILCSICPVNLSKAGLYYNTEKNAIEDRIRGLDRGVSRQRLSLSGFQRPQYGHSWNPLLHQKRGEHEPEPGGSAAGLRTSPFRLLQKETFHSVMESALGEDCGYELVRSLHEDLGEMLEAAKDSPEPLTLTKRDVRCILEENDIPEEKIQAFEKEFDESISRDTPVLVSNIVNTRQFQIETPDVVIKVKPERMDLVETKVIDGRTCLVIPVDEHIEVNGMTVSTIKPEEGMD